MKREEEIKKGLSLFAFVIIWIFCSLVFAQSDFSFLDGSKRSDFLVDYSCFKEDGEDWRLEVYYKIFNQKLSFVKAGGRFQASYEVNLTILDRKGHQVTATSLEENLFVSHYSETISGSGFLINMLNKEIRPGRYELVLELIDLNSSRSWVKKMDAVVPEYDPEKYILSPLVFSRNISDSVGNPKFEKRGKEVIPSVSRTFSESKFYLYYEIYGEGDPRKTFFLNYQVVDRNRKEKVLEEEDTLIFESRMIPIYREFSVEKIPPGNYTLSIILKDQEKETLAKSEDNFQIEWSMLSIIKADFEKAVDQLRYIATGDEMDRLRKSKKEDQLKEWAEFWRSKDPTPGTQKNELMEEYYRRLRYAERNFGLWNKEGWESDMGRIYMIYGHPDEIERHPFEMEGKPYQVWYYYNTQIKVVFVDQTGTGEWELDYIYDRGIKRK